MIQVLVYSGYYTCWKSNAFILSRNVFTFAIILPAVSVPANYSFLYNETLTPVITSMSPTFIREPGTITLEGSGLSNIGKYKE